MSRTTTGNIENLPLISRGGDGGRHGGGGGDDNTRRGDGALGTGGGPDQSSPASATTTVLPQSSRRTALGRTTATSMTTDSSHQQQQDQQAFPQQHSQLTPVSSSFYPQHQQASAHFEMQSSPPQAPPPYSQASNEFHDNVTFDGSEDTPAQMGGPTVTCRVCEAEIPIEGKTNQHVVRCLQCNEVTPIRAAPPGKKYVRCPCNCLLVCKATSTRIACPRQNCRRVITLASGPPNSGIPGTAIRAPVGTCRVQCAYCKDIFMFNTLTNQLAICPHCRKGSSVGASYTRSRSLLYFVLLMITSLFLIGVIIGITHGNNNFWMFTFMGVLLAACGFLAYRFVFFMRIRVSQVLGPL